MLSKYARERWDELGSENQIPDDDEAIIDAFYGPKKSGYGYIVLNPMIVDAESIGFVGL